MKVVGHAGLVVERFVFGQLNKSLDAVEVISHFFNQCDILPVTGFIWHTIGVLDHPRQSFLQYICSLGYSGLSSDLAVVTCFLFPWDTLPFPVSLVGPLTHVAGSMYRTS